MTDAPEKLSELARIAQHWREVLELDGDDGSVRSEIGLDELRTALRAIEGVAQARHDALIEAAEICEGEQSQWDRADGITACDNCAQEIRARAAGANCTNSTP